MKILVFAPHNDDEVLGVGGTMAKHIALGDEVYVCEVTASLVEKYKQKLQNEARKAHEFLGVKETFFLNLTVVELPREEIRKFNGAVSSIVETIAPDVVYFPFYGDMHGDHTAVANSVMVAVRPLVAPFVKEVYMYETLSETGWNYPTADKAFIPNTYVDITDYYLKKEGAMGKYQSQVKEYPHPRSMQAMRALAEYRGSTVGVHYAEAFMCVRRIIR
ncbi:MAG: PIG-L deacetylase family protein [Eubacteriales bacterium]|nr:PIG-L deacetylase family protein [Eubacteriales bacterium]